MYPQTWLFSYLYCNRIKLIVNQLEISRKKHFKAFSELNVADQNLVVNTYTELMFKIFVFGVYKTNKFS